MSLPDNSPELARLRTEELEFRRERLAYHRALLQSRMSPPGRLASRWAESPTRVTLLVAVLGLVATMVGGLWQTRTNTRLEKERFRAELISKALDVPDSIQKANNLRFLIRAGLVADDDGSLMQLANHPASLPQYSSTIVAQAPVTPAFNTWPSTFAPAPFHDLAMIDGYVAEVTGRDGRFAATREERDRGLFVEHGAKVVVSVYFHNGASMLGGAPLGEAKGVWISVVIPQETAAVHDVFAAVSCDNCATVRSDESRGGMLRVRSREPVALRIVPHTARLCSTVRLDPGAPAPERMVMTQACGTIPGAASLPLRSEPSGQVFNVQLGAIPQGYEGLVVFEVSAG